MSAPYPNALSNAEWGASNATARCCRDAAHNCVAPTHICSRNQSLGHAYRVHPLVNGRSPSRAAWARLAHRSIRQSAAVSYCQTHSHTPTAVDEGGWRKSCDPLLSEEVRDASDPLARARPATGVTALANRRRSTAGAARTVHPLVGSGLIRAGTGPRLRLLPPDGAPVGAGVPGRWSHRALRSPGGAGEPGRADGRFRHRAGPTRD